MPPVCPHHGREACKASCPGRIRTINAHQREQIERFGVEVLEMKSYDEHYELQFDSPVYISFDIDALDPAFAPGVSHREPGGCQQDRQSISFEG